MTQVKGWKARSILCAWYSQGYEGQAVLMKKAAVPPTKSDPLSTYHPAHRFKTHTTYID